MTVKSLIKNKKWLSAVGCLVVAILLFTPMGAHAQTGVETWLGNAALDMALAPIAIFLYGIASSTLSLAGWLLNFVLKQQVDVNVVRGLWVVIRDFANMFFIVAIIIMAFSTIFDLSGYDWKALLARFIIAAILINFSLAIGGLVIKITQVISNVFLTAIGDAGNRIGQSLIGIDPSLGTGSSNSILSSIANFVPGGANTVVAVGAVAKSLLGYGTIKQMFIDSIIMLIIAFSMFLPIVYAIVRIPMLWFLLITSPIAWIAYIFPGMKAQSNKWLDQFIGWNAFLPIYLFFLYLGLYILGQQATIMSTIFANGGSGLDLVDPITGLGHSFQALFFYAMVVIIMIGGTNVARGLSVTAGTGSNKLVDWAGRGAVAGWIGRTTGVSGAYEQRKKQFQKEGFQNRVLNRFYGGSEGKERTEAYVAGRIGVRDAESKQLDKDVSSSKDRMKTLELPELEKRMNQGSRYEQLAARELVNDKKGLNGQQVLDTYNLYGAGTLNAQKFIAGTDLKRLSREERSKLYGKVDVKTNQKINDIRAEKGEFANPGEFVQLSTVFSSDGDKADYTKKAKSYLDSLSSTDREAIYSDPQTTDGMRRELISIMADKGDFKDVNKIKAAVGLHSTEVDQLNFLDKVKKKNLVAGLQAQHESNLLKDTNGTRIAPTDTAGYAGSLAREVNKLSNEDILDLKEGVLEEMVGIDPGTGQPRNKQVRDSLKDSFTPKRIEAISNSPKATKAKLDKLQGVFKEKTIESIRKTKIDPLEKALEKIDVATTEIAQAQTSNDPAKQQRAMGEAKAAQTRAELLWNDIDEGDFGGPGTPEQAEKDRLRARYKTVVEKYIRTSGTPSTSSGGGSSSGGTPPPSNPTPSSGGGTPAVRPSGSSSPSAGSVTRLPTPGAAPSRPPQNAVEYLKENIKFFDMSSQAKAAEESLKQGVINDQQYRDIRSKYEQSRDKVSNLDLQGGLPNDFKRLATRQDFERKLKELQP